MSLARYVAGPRAGSLFYPPGALQIAAMLVIPFTEQIPWRGFVYPRSMFLVVVANAGIYLDNPMLALPANATPLAVHALGYGAVALALILLDGAAFLESAGFLPGQLLHHWRRRSKPAQGGGLPV